MQNRLSQAQLGKMAGKDRYYISKVESGSKDITTTKLITIFSALGTYLGALNPLLAKEKGYSPQLLELAKNDKSSVRKKIG